MSQSPAVTDPLGGQAPHNPATGEARSYLDIQGVNLWYGTKQALFDVDLEERPDGRVRSVVDQQADVQVPGGRTHPRNHLGRTQVEGLHLHFYSMPLSKLRGQVLEWGDAASNQHQVQPARSELPRERAGTPPWTGDSL